jgi:hypothetical protein
MGGIFISYRRSDVSGYALALHEKLANRFGAAQLFPGLGGRRDSPYLAWRVRVASSRDKR